MIMQARICRSVACPAIDREPVVKFSDSVESGTPHALILLPVPGRSRDKPRSYNGLASTEITAIQHKTCGSELARESILLSTQVLN